ncbi:carbon monoxide dehydrogenase [Clostridium sporogenes]|nr:carbon monoxide dehydrogenase [Clostridium sporogenes]
MNKIYNRFIDFIKLSVMGESILEKAEGRVSYHDSVEEMLKRIREDGMSNVFDRWIEQKNSL